VHVVNYFGKDVPVKSIWTPQIRAYIEHRLAQGAAGSTVNKEKSALSRMFQVLVDYRHVEANPARMVKGADESGGEREIYVGFDDFNAIVGKLPDWVQPIIQSLYFTGMRRGEVMGLTWDIVNLNSRIVRLQAGQTKERKKKRVPIHRVLVPILEKVKSSKLRSTTGNVFLTPHGKPPALDSLRKPWVKAVAAVGLKPAPTIHDLRHVWSTNAMRSGVDFEIREAIMGHVLKKKNISQRYLSFSDEDLVRAVDRMRFENGETEIWIANSTK
jgi:integrase